MGYRDEIIEANLEFKVKKNIFTSFWVLHKFAECDEQSGIETGHEYRKWVKVSMETFNARLKGYTSRTEDYISRTERMLKSLKKQVRELLKQSHVDQHED